MHRLVEESLAIVRPSLPAALIAPEVVPPLWAAARVLAPIPILRVGLECRLGAGASQVDLQQGFSTDDRERGLLADHVRALVASSDQPVPPAWSRLAMLCDSWRDPSSLLGKGISDVWLEFDVADVAPGSLIPSVFLGLNRDLPSGCEPLALAEVALATLQEGPLAPALRRNLERSFLACANQGRVSHVGVMLSRQIEALRLNIQCPSAESILPYLEGLGWPGPLHEVEALVARMGSFVDALTVCLDVGRQIYPRLGLECSLKKQPGEEPRWAAFLDNLGRDGLCTPEKRNALLAWPGYADPLSSPAPWPGSLIVESLLQGPDVFSVMARIVSHVKVTYQPQRPLEAKAYLGFGQVWLQPEPPAKAPVPGERPATVGRNPPVELADAIQAATGFLLKGRTQTGWWRDFPGLGGGSDEWVTAFTAAALATLPEDEARRAARHAWALLRERHTADGGWGYHAGMPVDADSTAWGLRLAAAIGVEASSRARQAWAVLEMHRLAEGGLATYREDLCSRPAVDFPQLFPFTGSAAGWCQTAHPCVTAVAAGLGDEPLLEYLRRTQRADGSWSAYWWEDAEYTTAFAAEALARTGRPADRPRVQAAVQAARLRLGNLSAHGADSAFVTAWCLRLLLLADEPGSVRGPRERAVQWLLDQQRSDGSWAPSARLRIPRVEILDPDQSASPTWVVLDEAAFFTTATVLAALARLRQGSG